MLGPYHLLPLLKGWEYKTFAGPVRTVTRGANPIELLRLPNELGWVRDIAFVSDDCYGGLEMSWQGADLQTKTGRWTAQAGYVMGALGPADPGGYVQLYYRPVPTSTYGAFLTICTMEGMYGAPLPYIPTVIVRVYLGSSSTQETATVQAVSTAVGITDRKAFIRSLRKVLGIKNMKIDPKLLSYGAVDLAMLPGEEW